MLILYKVLIINLLNITMKEFNQYRNLDPDDYYKSKEGYLIFTEKYHLKRGFCCNNNCKHCPFKKEIKKTHDKS